MEKIRYVPLAKSIPEYNKRDGSVYTCSLGYSPEKGLIRVYPLPLTGMYKWHIYLIPIEKNKRDSRTESFKLSSYSRKENWIGLCDDVKEIGVVKSRYEILNTLMLSVFPSISSMNKARVSIGVLRVKDYNLYWDTNERFIDTNQVGMFADVELADFTKYTKETKLKESRIIFEDGDGKHNIQFNEWQVYEFQRKFGATKDAFRNIKGEKLLLLGNMNAYRNTWIALGFFDLVPQLQLFC